MSNLEVDGRSEEDTLLIIRESLAFLASHGSLTSVSVGSCELTEDVLLNHVSLLTDIRYHLQLGDTFLLGFVNFQGSRMPKAIFSSMCS